MMQQKTAQDERFFNLHFRFRFFCFFVLVVVMMSVVVAGVFPHFPCAKWTGFFMI